MKIAMFAAALMLGTAGTAQDTMQPAPQPTEEPSGETVDDPSQATGPQGITQQGTDPNGQAYVPPGANQGAGVYPQAMAAPGMAPGMANYPPCSRTVTDRCIQTYERGVRRARR